MRLNHLKKVRLFGPLFLGGLRKTMDVWERKNILVSEAPVHHLHSQSLPKNKAKTLQNQTKMGSIVKHATG